LAFSKKIKGDMLASYTDWLNKSKGVFMVEYSKMTMKDVNDLRSKVREAGGEAHVVKNTLMVKALKQAGYSFEGELSKTTLACFAFKDAPALAKALGDVTKGSEIFSLKTGFLDEQPISAEQIKALANLPPLPVMRATLLGVLQAPASKLVRTLAEPARQLASVFKSYSEKDSASAEPAPTAG